MPANCSQMVVLSVLMLSTLGKNFSRQYYETFFLFFPGNNLHEISKVSTGDNLHEISKPIFQKIKKKKKRKENYQILKESIVFNFVTDFVAFEHHPFKNLLRFQRNLRVFPDSHFGSFYSENLVLDPQNFRGKGL